MADYDPNYKQKKSYALIGQKCIVLNSEGKMLILQRSEKSGAGGKWSLAGGALEHGEDPIESIKREINEEARLTVANIKTFSTRSYIRETNDFVVMIGYTCDAVSEEVTLNWEHDNFQWLSKADALNLDLTEDARFFIEHFEI